MNFIEPLVTIITPVYNCEKYLSECIESVLRQTYQNWEYIIVDNCSTDGSFEIAKSYADKDKRIKLVCNESFLDIISNWNNSLKYMSAQSIYCKFVHADDWLFDDCIEKMVRIGTSNPQIGIISAFRLEENKVTLGGLDPNHCIISGRTACRKVLLEGMNLFGSPTNVMYKSELIRNNMPFYNEENIHADLEVCFKILRHSYFGFIPQVLTFTRRHNESETSHNKFFNTHLIGALTIFARYGYFFLNEKEYERAIQKRLNVYYIKIARKMLKILIYHGPGKMKMYFDYHNNELHKLNIKFSLARLWLSMFILIYNAIIRKLLITI